MGSGTTRFPERVKELHVQWLERNTWVIVSVILLAGVIITLSIQIAHT